MDSQADDPSASVNQTFAHDLGASVDMTLNNID